MHMDGFVFVYTSLTPTLNCDLKCSKITCEKSEVIYVGRFCFVLYLVCILVENRMRRKRTGCKGFFGSSIKVKFPFFINVVLKLPKYIF